jgi:hypothetical protein
MWWVVHPQDFVPQESHTSLRKVDVGVRNVRPTPLIRKIAKILVAQ